MSQAVYYDHENVTAVATYTILPAKNITHLTCQLCSMTRPVQYTIVQTQSSVCLA